MPQVPYRYIYTNIFLCILMAPRKLQWPHTLSKPLIRMQQLPKQRGTIISHCTFISNAPATSAPTSTNKEWWRKCTKLDDWWQHFRHFVSPMHADQWPVCKAVASVGCWYVFVSEVCKSQSRFDLNRDLSALSDSIWAVTIRFEVWRFDLHLIQVSRDMIWKSRITCTS